MNWYRLATQSPDGGNFPSYMDVLHQDDDISIYLHDGNNLRIKQIENWKTDGHWELGLYDKDGESPAWGRVDEQSGIGSFSAMRIKNHRGIQKLLKAIEDVEIMWPSVKFWVYYDGYKIPSMQKLYSMIEDKSII